MYFSAATEPGAFDKANEDWAAVSPYAAVVLDGVTVFEEANSGCIHGTPWYVNQLGPRLLAAASTQDVSLQAALRDAISAVADLHADTCDLNQVGAPSAAVAIVRIGEHSVEYLVLADVTILLDSADGLSVLSDERVADTVNDLAGKESVGAEVMKRRERYRNREGGYWVAAADPSVADHAKTGQIPLKGFGHAALMSDGVTRLVSPFEQTSWHGLLAAVLNSGPASVIRHVRSIEAADAQGERWPRFKVSDDATIAVISALTEGTPSDETAGNCPEGGALRLII